MNRLFNRIERPKPPAAPSVEKDSIRQERSKQKMRLFPFFLRMNALPAACST